MADLRKEKTELSGKSGLRLILKGVKNCDLMYDHRVLRKSPVDILYAYLFKKTIKGVRVVINYGLDGAKCAQ
jgi:hypothetical protein